MRGPTMSRAALPRRFGAWFLVMVITPSVPAAGRPSGPPTPDEERATFRLADAALTIELAAAEPLVQSPVAIAWDESGALFVAEMLDYPDVKPSGRIKRLQDR